LKTFTSHGLQDVVIGGAAASANSRPQTANRGRWTNNLL